MEKVYICSAFRGDPAENIRKAREYCRYAATECGVMPIAPHLLFPQFLDDKKDAERELGIKMGLELLHDCSALWYFGDSITQGMVAEITEAYNCGIPVKYISEKEMNIQNNIITEE